uniref:Cysteine-serine-rich nuclear protein 2 n=2 Tax=Eptatretus burgeri TaxID=7764 RepID=A0A8C4R1E7_EPTBU
MTCLVIKGQISIELQFDTTRDICTSILLFVCVHVQITMAEVLKRKFEEVDGASLYSSLKDSEDELSSSESADSGDSLNPPSASHFTPASILNPTKRPRGKSVRFNQVMVYYFQRRQGFTSVPSQGGSTLGMAGHHNHMATYTLGEFARERETMHQHVLHQHLKEERLNSLRLQLTQNGTQDPEQVRCLTIEDIPDNEIDLHAIEVDDYFFLQPLPTRKRRTLLRAAGVRRIESTEKHELRGIRVSREDCGCDCRSYCDPESCACSQAGISCQVDRLSFPCGCTLDGCGNPTGRIEFNPVRVRTHFIHTIMRLELEKKQTGGVCMEGPMERADGATDLVVRLGEEGSAVDGLGQEVFSMTEEANPMMHLLSAETLAGDAGDSPSSGFASALCSSDGEAEREDAHTRCYEDFGIPTALPFPAGATEMHVQAERANDVASYSLDSSLFSFPSDESSTVSLFHEEEYSLGCLLPQSPLTSVALQDVGASFHSTPDEPQRMSMTSLLATAQDVPTLLHITACQDSPIIGGESQSTCEACPVSSPGTYTDLSISVDIVQQNDLMSGQPTSIINNALPNKAIFPTPGSDVFSSGDQLLLSHNSDIKVHSNESHAENTADNPKSSQSFCTSLGSPSVPIACRHLHFQHSAFVSVEHDVDSREDGDKRKANNEDDNEVQAMEAGD